MSSQKGANLEKDMEEAINWMQSLISDGAQSSTQGASADGFTAQVDDLIRSIQEPADAHQPKISDVCNQYSSLAKDAFGSVDPSPLTQTSPAKPATKQYRISDPIENSEDESDCEDYYVEDAAEIRGQEIPDWARGTGEAAKYGSGQDFHEFRANVRFELNVREEEADIQGQR